MGEYDIEARTCATFTPGLGESELYRSCNENAIALKIYEFATLETDGPKLAPLNARIKSNHKNFSINWDPTRRPDRRASLRRRWKEAEARQIEKDKLENIDANLSCIRVLDANGAQ